MGLSKKVKRLPFVVSPRLESIVEEVGSEESGKIEIERKGFLTVAEKAFSGAALAGDDSISALRRLAFRVSRETGKGPEEVMTSISQGAVDDYLAPYMEEVEGVLAMMTQYQERRAIIAATTLLTYRVDSTWTIDDTLALHPDLRDDLHLLFEDEEAKNTEALTSMKDETGKDGTKK